MLEQPETSMLEKNLRFVKNDLDDQLNTLFTEQNVSSAPFKMVKPLPGLCIKCFRTGTNEKFFINLCHTSEIPGPKDVTESELHKLIETQNASEFKVPLSVTKPREGKDKSGKKINISDVAINSEFYNKRIKHGDGLFYHFLITLVFESLEQKHKIEIDTNTFILLRNRVVIGELVEHQIYSRDVKTVEKYHENQDKNEILGADDSDEIVIGSSHKLASSKKVLIQEIPLKENETYRMKRSISKENEPEHRLITDFDEFNRRLLIAEFYLPEVRSISEVSVEANDDRLSIKSNHGYNFDGFLPHKINEDKTQAEFDNERMILKITMKV